MLFFNVLKTKLKSPINKNNIKLINNINNNNIKHINTNKNNINPINKLNSKDYLMILTVYSVTGFLIY